MSNKAYRLLQLHQRLVKLISNEMRREQPDDLRLLRLRIMKLGAGNRLATLTADRLATA